MNIHKGYDKETAIVIKTNNMGDSTSIEHLINRELNLMFGTADGNYFISRETNRTVDNQLYKVYTIEDKDGDHHVVFFKIIKPVEKWF